MKVFWSWQSDLSNKSNRHLIKSAITGAIKQVELELEIKEAERLHLDHDTKGEPGAVDIVQALFRKISESNAFIADITPIFVTDRGKHSPNPNVLIELGFALHSVGFERTILVLNEAFGSSPNDLPFDLRNRRCITYNCPADATKSQIKSAKQYLVTQLSSALKLNLSHHQNSRKLVVEGKIGSKAIPRTLWAGYPEHITIGGAFPGEPDQNFIVPDGACSLSRFAPVSWNPKPLSAAKYSNLPMDEQVYCPAGGASNGSSGATEDGFVNIWFAGSNQVPEARGITKYFSEEGEFRSWSRMNSFGEGPVVAPTFALKHWWNFLRSAAKFGQKYGADLPVSLELALHGTNGAVTPGDFTYQKLRFRGNEMRHEDILKDWSIDTRKEIIRSAYNKVLDLILIDELAPKSFEKLLSNLGLVD